MQEAVPEGVGKMAAILGLRREPINGILEQASRYGIVEVANYNCPGQVVISREKNAVEKAMEFAHDMGALNAAALQVSAPFHSSLLKSAGDKLHDELLNCRFYKGDIAVVANIDADYYGTGREEIINKLYHQVFSPVLFEDSINKLIADGFDTFIEVGPGKTLSRLVNFMSQHLLYEDRIHSIFKKMSCKAVTKDMGRNILVHHQSVPQMKYCIPNGFHIDWHIFISSRK